MLPAPPAPPNRDREALEAFYHATDGDNWKNNNNWLTDSPLDEWTGIKLNSHGRVEELILERNFLKGEIPEEIGDLDKLQALKLHSNNLSGPIPLSMAALTELTAFRIYDNAGICTPPDPNFQKWVNSLHTQLPACRDDDQKIVFVSDRDSPEAGFAEPNFEIYVMNADSTNQTRLTDSLGPDIQPAWSPDGTKIAFVSARDDSANIYVMDADGSNQTRLTNMRAANNLPTWSPDGQHIAFIIPRRHIYHTHEIHVMNADGSDLTTLTTEATPKTLIAWSPDSKRLAYVTWAQNPDNYRETHTLFTINRDGSNPTMVFETNSSIDYPVWMPEGHHLSLAFFHRGQPVALDGDTTVPLSTDIYFIGCTQHWSPDGKLIAFEHGGCSDTSVVTRFTHTGYPRSLNYTTYASIYLTNADGTGLQRLTDNESNNFHATFSPANGSPPPYGPKIVSSCSPLPTGCIDTTQCTYSKPTAAEHSSHPTTDTSCPGTRQSTLQRLANLDELNLHGNALSGPIPLKSATCHASAPCNWGTTTSPAPFRQNSPDPRCSRGSFSSTTGALASCRPSWSPCPTSQTSTSTATASRDQSPPKS